ncbi:hypothetical protein C0989_002621 [Termitomyces sp. Mn162]|nr:hypothetical protein C0989_002621 [Termitomyces sp. Mn162]
MIQQGKVHWNAKEKVILPSGAMIPNYFSKQLYMECIEEWHRLNPGQIITGRLSSNANPDPEQAAMQQLLIHKVMQQDVAMGQVLSKEERIKALERELFALRQPGKKFDGATPPTSNTSATSSSSNLTPAPAAKPTDKGKASEHTIVNEQPPVTKEPVAQPPIHPFSSIPGHYVPPTNRNFTAPDQTNNSAYQTMPPIYDIEQSKAVFEWVLSTKVTVLVGKLCSVSQDIRNQFRTAVMPKQLVGASANMVQDPSNIFEDILPTFAIEEPQFLLGSNVNTAHGLTSDKAPFASVDPIKAYIDLLPYGEEPVVLTVAKDSQSLHTIMMLINNKEEVECIHNSGSQIISMSVEIASDLGLPYNPNIVLNMQSANGTMDRLLGLARNIPCTIGNIMVYLQIHVLWSPAYDILLGRPFDVLTQSTVNTLSNVETTITITDPNTGQQCTIPTFPRGKSKRNNRQNTNPALAYLYAMASDISDLSLPPRSYLVSADTSHPLILGQTLPLDTHVTDTTPTYVNIPFPAQFVANKPPKQRGVQVKKKYKPVAMKTKPVASHVSEDFQIERRIIGNPLATIPQLNPNPPTLALKDPRTGRLLTVNLLSIPLIQTFA